MEKALPQIEREYKISRKTQKRADKLNNAIDDVVDAVKAGNPNPPVDELQKALDKFEKETQNDPSPEVREAGREAVAEAT